MKNTETITWKTFKDTLLQHPDLELQFQYASDTYIDSSYHITEIKQAPIISVDCGGVMSAWTEIIVQIYEPHNQQQERSMKVNKALSIIDVVEKKLSLNPNGIVKIEFGNAAFDTRQMFPGKIIADGKNLVIDLRPNAVQCKAISRGESCGTTAGSEQPYALVEQSKTKLKYPTLAAESCCTPGAGCC